MNISVDIRANRTIVHCTGRLDAQSGPGLETAVEPLVRWASGQPIVPVVLDLSGVEYLSSAGIRALLKLTRLSRTGVPQGYRGVPPLRIGDASAHVKQILETSGLWGELTRWTAGPPTAQPPAGSGLSYSALLEEARHAFPAPVSDPDKDAFFVHTITQSLDQLDGLKTERPYLGERTPVDYDRALQASFPATMSDMKTTVSRLVDFLQGMTIWGHPRTQVNVVPPTAIPGIMGQLFASIYNPNVLWDELSHRLAAAEVEVASMCSTLIGYDLTKAGGVFTFGGTGTTFYGVKLGIEKAQPGAFRDGVKGDLKVVTSDAAHNAKFRALGWLGLGTRNYVAVPTDEDNSMGLVELETTLRRLLDAGDRIACIIATMGTTDAFGIDNLDFIVNLRDRLAEEYRLPYRPHIHADAVIGWAWAVFNDYDFIGNPMGFPPRTLRSLWDAHFGIRALCLADSVGVDFHKTGYVPYTSSLVLCKDRQDLSLVSRDKEAMPHLFHFGSHHPGIFTMESSRSSGAVLAALANIIFFGKEGFRAILGHIVSVAEVLRDYLEKTPHTALVNDYNYGPVTLFRVYPEGIDAKTTFRLEKAGASAAGGLKANNDYNRKIFAALRRQMEGGEGVAVSITESCRPAPDGTPILAIKSFVMSPFAGDEAMKRLMTGIEDARRDVARDSGGPSA